MSAVVRVRRAAASEPLTAVAALHGDAFAHAWSAESMQAELQQNPVARLFVIENDEGDDGDDLCGFCSCWIVADELHINSLVIAPTLRRRGLARTLLAAVLAAAVAEGARSATLEARRSNTPALALYTALGFAIDGVRHDYYDDPREDALILWRRGLASS